MTTRQDVVSLRAQLEEMIRGDVALPADERKIQLAYVAGNAWRYAATIRHIKLVWAQSLIGCKVLDIGAYPGHLASVLSRYEQAAVIAVTLVSTPAFEVQMRAAGVHVARCDVERDPLPASDASIDVVLCCELIEHLDGEIQHLLREVRRVLSERGVFVLTTPNHAAMANRWNLLRGRSVYPPIDDPVYPFYVGAGQRNPWRHVREFTVAEVAGLVRRAGFAEVTVATVSAPRAGPDGLTLRGHLASCLLWAMERVATAAGTTIVVTAKG